MVGTTMNGKISSFWSQVKANTGILITEYDQDHERIFYKNANMARTLEWVAISFSNAWKWKVKWSHSVVSDSSRPHKWGQENTEEGVLIQVLQGQKTLPKGNGAQTEI